MEDLELLNELEPTVEKYFNRHLESVTNWYPHEYVPWVKGADLDFSKEWSPNDFPLPDAVRSALFVNLLTEDNLPYYHNTVNRVLGRNSVLAQWSKRWTAEETRHAIVIRDYLTVTSALDPKRLEDGRMLQMSGGVVPEPPNVPEILAYVTLQELATRISHRNTGKMVDEPWAFKMMARVAMDENFHHLFYRDLMTAVIEIAPSDAVIAIRNQVRDFQMPGVGIPHFEEHARAIAEYGIYDLILHHDQILEPIVMRQWELDQLEGLTAEAELARQDLFDHMGRLNKIARHIEAKREKAEADLAKTG